MCFTIIVFSTDAAHLPGVTDMGCNYLGDIECAIREIELCGLLQVCAPYLLSRASRFLQFATTAVYYRTCRPFPIGNLLAAANI
jgi:hypothetical protein